jgi:hypothetical protein
MAPDQSEINELYARPCSSLARLASQQTIFVDDVLDLNSIERYVIASEHWAQCNLDARTLLLKSAREDIRQVALNACKPKNGN